mmetsp:Transcript_2862/g.7492  ORF Transcript_2862/g.7492 Transcript_2862/m.7492 type:complete len:563 (+) Transcript_2862:242-1930(+)
MPLLRGLLQQPELPKPHELRLGARRRDVRPAAQLEKVSVLQLLQGDAVDVEPLAGLGARGHVDELEEAGNVDGEPLRDGDPRDVVEPLLVVRGALGPRRGAEPGHFDAGGEQEGGADLLGVAVVVHELRLLVLLALEKAGAVLEKASELLVCDLSVEADDVGKLRAQGDGAAEDVCDAPCEVEVGDDEEEVSPGDERDGGDFGEHEGCEGDDGEECGEGDCEAAADFVHGDEVDAAGADEGDDADGEDLGEDGVLRIAFEREAGQRDGEGAGGVGDEVVELGFGERGEESVELGLGHEAGGERALGGDVVVFGVGVGKEEEGDADGDVGELPARDGSWVGPGLCGDVGDLSGKIDDGGEFCHEGEVELVEERKVERLGVEGVGVSVDCGLVFHDDVVGGDNVAVANLCVLGDDLRGLEDVQRGAEHIRAVDIIGVDCAGVVAEVVRPVGLALHGLLEVEAVAVVGRIIPRQRPRRDVCRVPQPPIRPARDHDDVRVEELRKLIEFQNGDRLHRKPHLLRRRHPRHLRARRARGGRERQVVVAVPVVHRRGKLRQRQRRPHRP